jgi:hypothetical protein
VVKRNRDGISVLVYLGDDLVYIFDSVREERGYIRSEEERLRYVKGREAMMRCYPPLSRSEKSDLLLS